MNNNNISTKAKKIKLVATDIDGVWTDSKMYYTEEGEYMKSFSTYDGMAVSILKKHDIEVVILTSEKSNIVLERAKKLNIEYVYINEHEKLKRILYISKRLNIDMSEIAYIGDDINDLEVLMEFYKSGESTETEIDQLYSTSNELIEELELKNMLSDKIDSMDAVLQITAGAGGTESCDWAQMLMRMNSMYCDKNNNSITQINLQDGDSAGIKTVTLQIEGDFAFGWLKGENGVHRLVRISPFDSNAKRHTSFA